MIARDRMFHSDVAHFCQDYLRLLFFSVVPVCDRKTTDRHRHLFLLLPRLDADHCRNAVTYRYVTIHLASHHLRIGIARGHRERFLVRAEFTGRGIGGESRTARLLPHRTTSS